MRTLEIGGGSNRILALEGVRGIAVLFVFLAHFGRLIGPFLNRDSSLYAASQFWSIAGNSGVDLFFILSGYLIYGKLIGKHQSYLQFFWRRAQRIYPAFLVVLAIYLLLHFTLFPSPIIPTGAGPFAVYLLENLLLLPGLFAIPPVFTVAWSLSYELLFYTTIPLVAAVTRLRFRPARHRILFFLAVAVCYACLNWLYAAASISWLHLAPAAHPRLLMFVVGILLYEAQLSRLAVRIGTWGELAAAVLFLAGLAAYYLLRGNPWLAAHFRTALCESLVLAAAFPGVVLYSVAHSGPIERAFSWTPLRWLGNISYSYYLLHGLALRAVFLGVSKAIGPGILGATSAAALLLVAFAATVAVSIPLFLWVEKPLSINPAAPPPVYAGNVQRTRLS